MFAITLIKKYKSVYSYNIVIMNSKKKILIKLGSFFYNYTIKKFVLTIDLFVLLQYLRRGYLLDHNFYKIIYMYINLFI